MSDPDQDQDAKDFLESLLNKNLRVTTTDQRMFWGAFKCTDPVGLLSLSLSLQSTHRQILFLLLLFLTAAAAAIPVAVLFLLLPSRLFPCLQVTSRRHYMQESNVVLQHTYEYRHPSAQQLAERAASAGASGAAVKMEMMSRYLGLVVVPGEHIAKIEVEEFASQRR